MFISVYLFITCVTIAITIVHEECCAERTETSDRSVDEAVVYPEVLETNFNLNHHYHHHRDHNYKGDVDASTAEKPDANGNMSINAAEVSTYLLLI